MIFEKVSKIIVEQLGVDPKEVTMDASFKAYRRAGLYLSSVVF